MAEDKITVTMEDENGNLVDVERVMRRTDEGEPYVVIGGENVLIAEHGDGWAVLGVLSDDGEGEASVQPRLTGPGKRGKAHRIR